MEEVTTRLLWAGAMHLLSTRSCEHCMAHMEADIPAKGQKDKTGPSLTADGNQHRSL